MRQKIEIVQDGESHPQPERSEYMSKTSSAVKNRYNSKTYDRVTLAVPKGSREKWKTYAETKGKSLTQFIRELVENEIKKA